jgi:uncharacterized surface protein with fasciclin (FAS1) repeats
LKYSGNENFSTLVTIVTTVDLRDYIKQTGPITVFAPTNDAFIRYQLKEQLETLLKQRNKKN